MDRCKWFCIGQQYFFFKFFLWPTNSFFNLNIFGSFNIVFWCYRLVNSSVSSMKKSRNHLENALNQWIVKMCMICLQKNLEKNLREFHPHIFTEVLPEAIQNISYCVGLMKENKEKMGKKDINSKIC